MIAYSNFINYFCSKSIKPKNHEKKYYYGAYGANCHDGQCQRG